MFYEREIKGGHTLALVYINSFIWHREVKDGALVPPIEAGKVYRLVKSPTSNYILFTDPVHIKHLTPRPILGIRVSDLQEKVAEWELDAVEITDSALLNLDLTEEIVVQLGNWIETDNSDIVSLLESQDDIDFLCSSEGIQAAIEAGELDIDPRFLPEHQPSPEEVREFVQRMISEYSEDKEGLEPYFDIMMTLKEIDPKLLEAYLEILDFALDSAMPIDPQSLTSESTEKITLPVHRDLNLGSGANIAAITSNLTNYIKSIEVQSNDKLSRSHLVRVIYYTLLELARTK